ncbi:hypothetical protein BU25DRAFT_439935 [Macroventuria anomochaeta]|uniref:Uncharacterized protein n=1 Tax=Macroventuria anomochaeta TaxID=301207 RepID=A0ACB6S1W1_9PLEO|nr:uncharacterized protein BU25DRAFT_439935 [Macroventuria anomochaeta]KAF2627507.1 hypothetical protein BU25DRAFT_439935 [Macroventuria anomochaeta]
MGISRRASQGLLLALPCGTNPIRLGMTFHSRLQSTLNPWSEETPFVLSNIHIISKELHFEYGTNSTFKKASTSRQSETGDHLSLGSGVDVRLPFVANVSVKGMFGQHIPEDKDSYNISINSSCRAGTIEYGDHYLAGYRLSGETGILLSASRHTKEVREEYKVKATVTDFKTRTLGRQVKLLGYDTVDSMTWETARATGDDLKALKQKYQEAVAWEAFDLATDAQTLRADADAIMARSESLLERVGVVLERHGYRNGENLTFLQCEELVKEGIMVELLLEPMSRLKDVGDWRRTSSECGR